MLQLVEALEKRKIVNPNRALETPHVCEDSASAVSGNPFSYFTVSEIGARSWTPLDEPNASMEYRLLVQ